MINDLKIALTLSILVHVSVFLVTAYKSKSVIYLSLPVEIFFYNAPSPTVSSGDIIPKEKEKDEVVIPKKEKRVKEKKKLKETKTETKQETTAGKASESAPAHLVPSGQISVDSARFPYTYYTSMIVKKISRNWQWAVEFGRLKAVVYFKIQKDGSLTEVTVKESSGDSLYDQQALRAIKLSDPFPPLPQGYPEDNLGVFFEFTFKE
ncbi:MAG: TonB family protein [Elusimicrobia bacterium]|nr:TonB family protein [Candidatus Liberimonas magnetica]